MYKKQLMRIFPQRFYTYKKLKKFLQNLKKIFKFLKKAIEIFNKKIQNDVCVKTKLWILIFEEKELKFKDLPLNEKCIANFEVVSTL